MIYQSTVQERERPHQRHRLVAICAALVVLAAGCSGGSGHDEAHQPAPPAPLRPVDPRDVVMRPKSFFDDTHTIVAVTDHLIQACMAKQGYRYDGQAQTVDRFQGELDPDMEYHRTEGYGFAHYYRPIYQPPDDIVKKYAIAIRGDGEDVKYKTLVGSGGMDAGGCSGAAKTRVAGSVLDWYWAVNAEQEYWVIFALSNSDHKDWRDAVDRWRACMADAGWPDIGGPDGPRNKAQARYLQAGGSGAPITDDLRSFETDLATADGRCRTSSGMVDVSRQLRSDFLDTAPANYMHDLRRIAAARTKALRTIQKSGLR